jgi:predicted transposase YdaD
MGIFKKEDDVTVCELWDEVRQEGRQEGKEEGRQEGRQEGEDKLARLISKLMTEKRFDDVTKATTDAEYRKALYDEYSINV